MPKKLLEIKEVVKNFKAKNQIIKVLKGVSFSIERGEIISLLGVNGAGKTTLTSIIASLHPPTDGDVLYEGKSIYKNLINYRFLLGYCPQSPNFADDLTVEENLVFAGRYFSMSKDEIDKRIKGLLKQFDLEKYSQSKPGILSGGYKQRLLVARSLIHDPSIVILDEPTVGMDPQVRKEFLKKIEQLKHNGVTVILVSHFLDIVEKISDRVCIIDQGVVREVGQVNDLKKKYKKTSLEEVFFLLTDKKEKNL
ncbi:ABC transporter ATP-binding protein [bacterium]|nr:ABC transporter ATP-binding protein [bacterium]